MADVTVRPSAEFEHPFGWGVTGLAGTIGIRILDNDGNVTVARTTTGITELVAGSGEYVVQRNAPAAAGTYAGVIDDGAVEPGHVYTFSIEVTSRPTAAVVTPNDRDLCALSDVTRYAPGYDSTTDEDADDLNDILLSLIAAESEDWHDITGREFVAVTGNNTRLFDLATHHARSRRVRIGDCADVTTVRILTQAGDVIETVAADDRVEWPRNRADYHPITALWFPPASTTPAAIASGRTLEVTGTWGFPSIPASVREAVAGMVLVRYVQAVAAGELPQTAFSDATVGISVGGLLAAARRTMNRWTRAAVA